MLISKQVHFPFLRNVISLALVLCIKPKYRFEIDYCEIIRILGTYLNVKCIHKHLGKSRKTIYMWNYVKKRIKMQNESYSSMV